MILLASFLIYISKDETLYVTRRKSTPNQPGVATHVCSCLNFQTHKECRRAYHFHHVRAPLGQKLQALQSQVEELPVLSIRLLGLLPARPGDHLGYTGKGIQRKPAKLPSLQLCNTALWVRHPPCPLSQGTYGHS